MTNTDFTARCIAGKALEDIAGKQDTITDLDTIRAGAAAGATAVQPADMTAALAAKQDVLTTEQLASVNSGITSTDVEQIETNKNNISKITPAHLITTDTATSITITGLDSTYNTNCLILCTDRRTTDAVDSVYFVSRYSTVVRIAVLSGNTTPTATISGDIITISGLRTYQTITVLAAKTVGIAAV